jgi:hypothetical protein
MVRKIEPGDVIGRCRTVRELGRGGVGTVYLAEHQTLQIEVALKILSPALSLDNPALAERFIREAQLAARIRHPNVISVMDAAHDEATGLYFIVMEYVGGGSLAWHLRHGPLPEKKALAIAIGITHALVIAEENRIVHRDIKPENIMLDLRGTPKLADLGLAKHSLDTTLTIGGSFMGTPAYMSPDQARDAKIADTRDDIYSLGASFYECLTGEPPFQGETPYNIMSELLTKPSPRPRTLRPDVSRAADLICRKMMAKTRDLRYQNARDLLSDLQIAQAQGDRGIDQLEAASFDRDAALAHEREQALGVETSTDGVYAEPDETPSFVPPSHKANRDVFGGAVLLIALVFVTTLLLGWAGPHHPLTFLRDEWLKLTGQTPAAVTPVVAKPAKEKENEHSHAASVKPLERHDEHVAKTVVTPNESTPSLVAPRAEAVEPAPVEMPPAPLATDTVPAAPVALPVTDTNTAPIAPMPVSPLASTSMPDSAFTARDVAERAIDPSLFAPTGRAELLRIVGKRDDNSLTPATWTFFFYDKAAAGHARIVTVNGGKVTKAGEDLVDFAAPYTEQMAMPEDQIGKDSTDALQIVQALIPDATVTGAEFTLAQQKNSVPMWKVTIWGKGASGDADKKLGDVTLLAENGTVIQKNLK